MKLKCPDCGSTIDVDRLRSDNAFREIIEIYKRMPKIEALLIGEYIDCFRASTHAEMSAKKYLRILKQTVQVIENGIFHYARQTYHLSDRSVCFEALQKTVDTEKRAFRNHHYWFAIMIGLLKKLGATQEQEAEDRRRQDAERRLRPEDPGRDELPPRGMPIPEKVRGFIKDL